MFSQYQNAVKKKLLRSCKAFAIMSTATWSCLKNMIKKRFFIALILLFDCYFFGFFSPVQAGVFSNNISDEPSAKQIELIQNENHLYAVLSELNEYTAQETLAMLYVVCLQQFVSVCKSLSKNKRKGMVKELKECYMQGQLLRTKKIEGMINAYDINIKFFQNQVLAQQPLGFPDFYQVMNALLHFEAPNYTENEQVKTVINNGLQDLKQKTYIARSSLFFSVLHLTNNLYVSLNKDNLNHGVRESPCRWPLINEITLWFADYPNKLIKELLIESTQSCTDVNKEALFKYIQNKILTGKERVDLENKQLLETLLNNPCYHALIKQVGTVQNLYNFYKDMKVPSEPLQQEKAETTTKKVGGWRKITRFTQYLYGNAFGSETEKYCVMVDWLQHMRNHETTLAWCDVRPAASMVINALYDIAQKHSDKEKLSIKEALGLLIQQRFEAPLKDKAVNLLLCKTRQTDGQYYSYSRKTLKVPQNKPSSSENSNQETDEAVNVEPESCLAKQHMHLHSESCALKSSPPCIQYGGCKQHKRGLWVLMPEADYLRKAALKTDTEHNEATFNDLNAENLSPHRDWASLLEDGVVLPEDEDQDQDGNLGTSAANRAPEWSFVKMGCTLGIGLMLLAAGLNAYETDMARLERLDPTFSSQPGRLSEFTAKCPDRNHRRIIEKYLGCGERNPYHCFLDINKNTYKHGCYPRDQAFKKGYREIDFDNRHSGICSKGTYQPFEHHGEHGPGCVYQTDKCIEEGQIKFHKYANNDVNVSAVEDAECICDQQKNFLDIFTYNEDGAKTRTRNKPCLSSYFAKVGESDCTCFLDPDVNYKHCSKGPPSGGEIILDDQTINAGGNISLACSCEFQNGFTFHDPNVLSNALATNLSEPYCFACNPEKFDCSCNKVGTCVKTDAHNVLSSCARSDLSEPYSIPVKMCPYGYKGWVGQININNESEISHYGRWKLFGAISGCIGCAIGCGGFIIVEPSFAMENRGSNTVTLLQFQWTFDNKNLSIHNFQPKRMVARVYGNSKSNNSKVDCQVSKQQKQKNNVRFIVVINEEGDPVVLLILPQTIVTKDMLVHIKGRIYDKNNSYFQFDTNTKKCNELKRKDKTKY